jgi:hypothetical protein
MDHALISLLIFVIVVVVLVALACWVIDRTIPGEFNMIAKLIVGVIGLVAILYRLLPLAGIS